jgi:hypothetical protein
MPPEQPEHYRYGGGVSGTVLHPVVLVAMLAAIVLIFVLPRRYAALPFLGIAFLTPIGQQLYLVGVHWFVLRIVILAGLIRVFTRKEHNVRGPGSHLHSIERPIIIYILAQAICVVLLFRDSGALVNQIGFVWDMFGSYFLLHALIRDERDMYRTLKFLAVVTLPLAVGMVIEQEKLVNIFGQLGALPLVPEIREGKIRSQGMFTHSLMAGSFAAAQIPLFVLLWKNGKAQIFGALGIIGALVMTITSNSSTPLMALFAGFFGMFLWPLRKKMRAVRWGIVISLFVLNLAMKAPIWFLIARIDLAGGSSSYHRAELINEFVNHFSSWWLIGTADNGSWGWDMFDVQNQYVNIGETGGLLALVCFILVISRCFGRLGDYRKRFDGNRRAERTCWFLGSALFANVVAFFGVNYFDQSREGWFLLLVFIDAITTAKLVSKPQARALDSPELGEQVSPPFVGLDEMKCEGLMRT